MLRLVRSKCQVDVVKSGYISYGQIASVLNCHAMNTLGRIQRVQLHTFLTWVPGGEWSASHPGLLITIERVPDTHYIRGLKGPRAGLDAENGLSVQEIAYRFCGR
jgi:hypothetical protein